MGGTEDESLCPTLIMAMKFLVICLVSTLVPKGTQGGGPQPIPTANRRLLASLNPAFVCPESDLLSINDINLLARLSISRSFLSPCRLNFDNSCSSYNFELNLKWIFQQFAKMYFSMNSRMMPNIRPSELTGKFLENDENNFVSGHVKKIFEEKNGEAETLFDSYYNDLIVILSFNRPWMISCHQNAQLVKLLCQVVT
uniref:Uncharacterized protein n=1 Tax=Romanomermis culicivorax TaxID=13658 RepID=A0A915IIH6_ROMCU